MRQFLVYLGCLLISFPMLAFDFRSNEFTSSLSCASPIESPKTIESPKKIVLIPLDNRPPCLQFPVRMAALANYELIVPPEALLGNLQEAADSEGIITWLKKQSYENIDGIIVVADMLAFGGLVASRTPHTNLHTALRRLEVIQEIKAAHPQVPLMVQSVLMRLAPTAEGTNEAYRVKLAKWAAMPTEEERDIIGKDLPEKIVENYQSARARNHQVNLALIDMAAGGAVDFLVFSQDDAKPTGIHIDERKSLVAQIKAKDLAEKTAIQAGTDEVAMLLLARMANRLESVTPHIKVHYSSGRMSKEVMPFEDVPLDETVSKFIRCAGGNRTDIDSAADLHWYVYTSRHDSTIASTFPQQIEAALTKGQRVLVADIDPIGDIQGGDVAFSEALISTGKMAKLYGYASWNTAGNTLGTVLPQGLLYFAGSNRELAEKAKENMTKAQCWFTYHRILNDYVYNHLIRASYQKALGANYSNAKILSPSEMEMAEALGLEILQNRSTEFSSQYFGQNSNCPLSIKNLSLDLPWGRAFEAFIDFDLE